MIYRAYIKDSMELNEKPKAIIPIKEGSYSEDLLTNATSSFEAYDDLPLTIQNGDFMCVFKPNGRVVYQGIIQEIEDKTITCDQILSIFRGNWFYVVEEKPYLEQEVYEFLKRFMNGVIGDLVSTLPEANETNWKKKKLYFKKNGDNYEQYFINRNGNGSDNEPYTYSIDMLNTITAAEYANATDKLVKKKYGQFTVTWEGSQTVHLTTGSSDNEVIDIEDFVYSLYENYGIVVEINIPFNSGCTITIKTPNYEGTKIAKNSKSIISISPRKETAECNKLVVMNSNGSYRTSFYSTTDGISTISDAENRLPIVNTKIVYSDDDIEDIKAEYLKEIETNHEISFEMYLDSNLYDWESWRLGMPFEVHYKNEIYNSYFTRYEADLDDDSHTVTVTCGIVRSKLTDKIGRGGNVSIRTGGSGLSDVTTKEYVDNKETAANTYTDTSYNNLKAYVDQQDNSVKTYVNNKDSAMKTYVDNKDAAIQNDLDTHVHGYIQRNGSINKNVAIASGDRLVFRDASDSNKIVNSSTTFGTDIWQYLSNAGSWQEIANAFRGHKKPHDGIDLNTITEPGIHYVSSGTTALNFPAGNNGILIVLAGGSNANLRQIFIRQGTIGNNEHMWYLRGIGTDGTYGAWHRILTDKGIVDTTIAAGDKMLIFDDSAGYVRKTSIEFGSSTTQFLTNKGTWAIPSGTYSKLSYSLLWTNPTPTSNFASQEIALDFSSYNFVLIVFRATTKNAAMCQHFIKKGTLSHLYFAATPADQSSMHVARSVRVYNNRIWFDTSSSSTGPNTGDAIPVYIYGVK